ncbi:TVG0172799 [Thermoplasma volcanium GSS1]|uniref:TVG0172799 protein n=1 Tax=Thermoplasma volcanium (strain ATCC 51530 / DSM 4299 / JCM 9571 / NBRC 15438 / GSS1) TaxID=273116 RepID=Q97CE0_THEVO|nr:IS1634-like element ISTvo4 family transposase [Thermoplasma volcanium]BAB59304.1 TVG0172799 [Thermoplasma volcanium GSS1]
MDNIPDWVLRQKRKGIEIRRFGDRYYAYEVTSKYDKELKRARKVTGKYLGVVTKDGIVKKGEITGIKGDYEYGNIALLYGIAERTVIPVLREIYPTMWKRIISYVILRNIQPLPMKSVHYLYEKTYLPRIMDESMSPDSLSRMLSSLPEDQSIRVMKKLTEKGEYVLMDSTAIFSRSENMSFLELGHNSKGMHLPQINVMMLFSSTRTMPTFVRILPGSIRDASAMSKTIDMAGVDRCVIVADKGFFSAINVKKLKRRHLSYIIPLRRNSSLIPEPEHFMGVFSYDGKPVKYWKRENDVYIFEDPVLRSEEEKDFLLRIEENKRSRKQYDENEINFGKLYLLSDLNEEPERIYRLYKQREYVEYAFNVYKNDLEADRSYLRDDHMLFTYMFLNLLSLYLHFQILNMIDGKYSVKDILLILSRIKMYRTEKGEIMSEIPKKANDLVSTLNIDLDLLRKKA